MCIYIYSIYIYLHDSAWSCVYIDGPSQGMVSSDSYSFRFTMILHGSVFVMTRRLLRSTNRSIRVHWISLIFFSEGYNAKLLTWLPAVIASSYARCKRPATLRCICCELFEILHACYRHSLFGKEETKRNVVCFAMICHISSYFADSCPTTHSHAVFLCNCQTRKLSECFKMQFPHAKTKMF